MTEPYERLTPRAKKVVELALREALSYGSNYIEPEHLLLGLMREGSSAAAFILWREGLDCKSVSASIATLRGRA